jgi:histidyl-tRNA synthetase
VIECKAEDLPAQPGAYVLEFDVKEPVDLSIGRLGAATVGPGRFRYYGSARGPGGLRARVLRHLEPEGRSDHWHVDVLTRTVPVARIWIALDSRECELVARDRDSGDWDVAVQGFGSSDCRRCRAHLLVFRE